MKRKLLPSLAALVLSLIAASTRADTITLKDGRIIEGQLVRQGNNFLIQPDQGASFTVPVSDLAGIVLGGTGAVQRTADSRWQLTLDQISQETDLSNIIRDVQACMKQYPDSADIKQMQAVIAQYVEYQAQGYIKFAGKWMSPADAQTEQSNIQEMIADTITMDRGGSPARAQAEARKVLAIDPTNTDAQIVVGVTLFEQNDPQDALAQFNTVLERDPNNVIALNDAAVASYRSLPLHAFLEYQLALNQVSTNRLLLDNIASALIDYQGDQPNLLYMKLQGPFTAADLQMQSVMAQQGLYRAEAIWVPSDQKAQVDAIYQQFQQQKNALQANYNAVQGDIANVNSQLNATSQQMNQLQQLVGQLEAQEQTVQYQTGTDGTLDPVPSVDNSGIIDADNDQISQLQQQQQGLLAQRNQDQIQIQNIQNAARVLMQSEPSMVFSGKQSMMLPGDVNNVPPPS
ncbi:MAG TPA: tetratricopeptide repeat protein [Phycisphaerae bacterium]|nr:tetratricopeptide repeat protein [Phycisphaerae bacterium]